MAVPSNRNRPLSLKEDPLQRSIVVSLLFFVTLVLIATPIIHATDRMKSGQWEVSLTDDSGHTATNTHCNTPEQVKITNGSSEEIRASLEKSAGSLHCTIQNFKLENNTVSYTYACPGRSTDSRTSYHNGDSYETAVTSRTNGKERTSQINGRRLGDCP